MAITVYHYLSDQKLRRIVEQGFLEPIAPFNSHLAEEHWNDYIKQFPFPVVRKYIFAFFQPEPTSWKEFGLFDLLKEETAGDRLLEIALQDDLPVPVLVREHKFHSPKEYGCSPEEWKKPEIRNSRPELREQWYSSAVTLNSYNFAFICPEVLVPIFIPLARARALK
ncbi:hypothetical protein J4479_00975 [Candidatus Woesearchaeota archaeon]|nr:hypothetical protein [Candidatus Woesearchaeota archaeon]